MVSTYRLPTIHLKLLRELRRHWVQIVSIALVMGCGTMTIMGLRGTLRSIRTARDAYYSAYRFGDVFAQVQRAPMGLMSRIVQLPGVAAAEGRLVKDVKLEVPGLADVVTGHVVSIPDEQRPMLNELQIRRGRYIARGRDDEVLLGERFAELNGIAPGDSIAAVINGRWKRLHVVGLAISPEFVVEMAASGLFVDHRRYGVVWSNAGLLSTAFGMSGAFNDVVIRLAEGASSREVMARLDDILEPWGNAGAYDRADQPAARVLEDEFSQLRTNANLFPMFFLVVAAFLLNIVLSRLVTSQRDEIAALKAFGYSNGEIGRHYLGFGVATVLIGSAVGLPAGIWMSAKFTSLYADYFRFPSVPAVMDWPAAALAVFVSTVFALLGAFAGVRRVTKLAPAEALRPESPRNFRRLLLERLGMGRLLSPGARVAFRNIERRPLRAATTVIGIAMAVALLASGQFPYDALDRLIEVQFSEAQPASAVVIFAGDRSTRALEDLRRTPGVVAVEPFRTAAVRLHGDRATRTSSITAVEPNGSLFRMVDVNGVNHVVPRAGALMTSGLARVLGVRPGDSVTVELLQHGNEIHRLGIAGLYDPMVGQGLYMTHASLNRLLRDQGLLSGAYLGISTGAEEAAIGRLKRVPGVAGVQTRRATLQNIDEQMRDSMSFALTLIITSACLIAVGVVYNSARIALSERSRELATLRVLGFSTDEVARMLFGEQVALLVLALPTGVGLAALLDYALARGFASERFQFPYVLELSSQILATLIVVVASILTGLVVRRRVGRLDLVAALRTRE